MFGFLAITPRPGAGHITEHPVEFRPAGVMPGGVVFPPPGHRSRRSGQRISAKAAHGWVTNSPLTSWPLSCIRSASISVLPPGAAQRSSTCLTGAAPTKGGKLTGQAFYMGGPCCRNSSLSAGLTANSCQDTAGHGPCRTYGAPVASSADSCAALALRGFARKLLVPTLA